MWLGWDAKADGTWRRLFFLQAAQPAQQASTSASQVSKNSAQISVRRLRRLLSCMGFPLLLQSTGDVYINEPKPLREGESKHVISVFVADEAGLINRVAGVFARRGQSKQLSDHHAHFDA
jgi:hypothetical protein